MIWLVGHYKRYRCLERWNRSEFYSSITLKAHNATLAPASYCKPDLTSKIPPHRYWSCWSVETWPDAIYEKNDQCSVANRSPLISKASCVTNFSDYVANVLLYSTLVRDLAKTGRGAGRPPISGTHFRPPLLLLNPSSILFHPPLNALFCCFLDKIGL